MPSQTLRATEPAFTTSRPECRGQGLVGIEQEIIRGLKGTEVSSEVVKTKTLGRPLVAMLCHTAGDYGH